jgi:hypothetical protein
MKAQTPVPMNIPGQLMEVSGGPKNPPPTVVVQTKHRMMKATMPTTTASPTPLSYAVVAALGGFASGEAVF